MLDILFDIEKRDIVLSKGTHGDFVQTTNPSVQDGGALLYSRGANLRNPMMGVGIEQIVNAGAGGSVATREMNRWKSQVAMDGGIGKWSPLPGPPFNYQIDVNYLL